jgi:hypothetical protein
MRPERSTPHNALALKEPSGRESRRIHPRRRCGHDPRFRIFERETTRWIDTQTTSRFEVNIGGWLSPLDLVACYETVVATLQLRHAQTQRGIFAIARGGDRERNPMSLKQG